MFKKIVSNKLLTKPEGDYFCLTLLKLYVEVETLSTSFIIYIFTIFTQKKINWYSPNWNQFNYLKTLNSIIQDVIANFI